MGKRGAGNGSSKTSMIYNNLGEMDYDRELENWFNMLDDEEDIFLDDDDEELKDEE